MSDENFLITDEDQPITGNSVIKAMKPRHQEIARRLVLGQSQGEICKVLGMTPAWMSQICNSVVFKRYYKKLSDYRDRGVVNIQDELLEIAPQALEVIERLLYNSKKEDTQYKAAKLLMEMAGFGGINKTLVQVTKVNTADYSEEEIARTIMQRVKRMKEGKEREKEEMKEAETIDVEWQEVEPDKKYVKDEDEDLEYGSL